MAQTKPKAGQFYGVSGNGTDGQFLKTDGAGGMSWASTIVDPTITSIDYPGTATAANPAGGESVIINGTLFASGITCTVGGTSAVTTFNSATQITITTPAKTAGQYTVAVTNSNGGTASQANFIQYSGVPVWSTASGSLGSVTEGATASFQVTATEGSDTIEYAVTTGSLPSGLSLNTNTGAITGTAPSVSADTTTTFSITATDDENQTSSERSFSITVANDNPSNYFNTVLYTGTSASHAITGVGFQPDLVWIKRRSSNENSALYDSIRGVNKQLESNTANAQATNTAPYEGFTAFGTDGFTVDNNGGTNSSGQTYVAWCFKAGGAAVSNTDGTINSQVSVNNALGFSIVQYDGNSSAGATVGHGLSSAPETVWIKCLTNNSTNWINFFNPLGNSDYLTLNLNNDVDTFTNWFYSNATTFTLNQTFGNANTSGRTYIAYCFTSKPGFSKVGNYTGNGSTNGPIVSTGFKPAMIIIKRTDSAEDWKIIDNKRATFANSLEPNEAIAEEVGNNSDFTVLSNGFQIGDTSGDYNSNGGEYIYIAFAADPDTTTPSLADSFDIALYTGTSSNQSITGTGFKPDLTWVKSRTYGYPNILADSVRGTGSTKMLISDFDGAEGSSDVNYANAQAYGYISSLDADGFSAASGTTNGAYTGVASTVVGSDYVSWNWKAGGTPALNTAGTVNSIVSANQAAGFSIVKCTSPSSTINFNYGHGLSTAPELVIVKTIGIASYWEVIYPNNFSSPSSSSPSDWNRLKLNATDAKLSSNTYLAADNTKIYNGAWGANTSLINYCFTSISNYSKVGTYTGSSSALTVNIGFAPTFALIKRTDSTGGWRMFDTVRGTDKSLQASSPGAEYDDTSNYMDFTSTGFYFSTSQQNPDINASGGEYIYLAIKEN